jgi:hypothetical protein
VLIVVGVATSEPEKAVTTDSAIPASAAPAGSLSADQKELADRQALAAAREKRANIRAERRLAARLKRARAARARRARNARIAREERRQERERAKRKAAEEKASSCHPGYSGACLEQGSGDYDCADGSGDGPNYTGSVQVVGYDEFDLDRDGDGAACE